MLKPRFLTLIQVKDDSDAVGLVEAVFSNNITNLSDKYVPTLQMPLAEMSGISAVPIVEELVDYTNAASWLRNKRRPVQIGDVVAIGNVLWLVTDATTRLLFEARGLTTYQLNKYPKFGIVRIVTVKITN
jgi:hypothetical protein